jgi:hypothetical protein
MDLLTRLINAINGEVSEEGFFAEFPFTRYSNTILGRKPCYELGEDDDDYEPVGRIADIKELAVYQYGGLVPEEAAREVALRIIADGLLV